MTISLLYRLPDAVGYEIISYPSRLPVAMSKIPTVTERLQMTERNILNRLLAARNLENGEKATSAIIPGA